MPRIRTVKPEFWQDEKLAPMPVIDRLVFLGLISMADDAGRLIDNVKAIDGFLFSETDDSARDSIARLAHAGRIERYAAASGQRLIQITGWARHQKVDKPSQHVLPAPTADRPTTGGDGGGQPSSNGSRSSRETVASPPRSDLGSGSGDQGAGTEERGPKSGTAARATPAGGTPVLPIGERRSLASLRAALLDEAYAGATSVRRAEVEAQLDAVLTSEGAKIRKGEVAYATERSLAAAIADTLAELRRGQLKKPDAAIVVVLRKCQSGKANADLDAAGRTPSEAQAARVADDGAKADAEFADRRRRAEAWSAAHPDEFEHLRRAIVGSHGHPCSWSFEGLSAFERYAAEAELVAACLRAARSPAAAGAGV